MIWLLRDFDLLTVLLHAAALSFEAVLLGGIAFLLVPARQAIRTNFSSARETLAPCLRLMQYSAVGLAATELAAMGVSSATMLAGSSLTLAAIGNASFFRAQTCTVLFALTLAVLARLRFSAISMIVPGTGALVSIVYLSHALSQMQHRVLLTVLTGLHHLGTAAWIGAMPYLLIFIARERSSTLTEHAVRRYSAMAMVSVALLVAAGVGMAWFYVGSIEGIYGTSYGLMLLAKVFLLLMMLILGAGNWYLVRHATSLPVLLLTRIRRFTEVEMGLGFVVLLAAASLTSQSPSADVLQHDMVSFRQYRQSLAPVWPSLTSPPVQALKPPSSLLQGVEEHQFGAGPPNDANDDAWSNYNHHWAGLMVLLAGLLALFSRWSFAPWARYWPVSFAGLAVFIILRADPEAWPLGPRPFWASFAYPDVLEHRLEAALILAFAAFEAAVQAGKLRRRWITLVFPVICGAGAAVLLTHTHGFGNPVSEVLAEASHTAIALLGATVAAARWLELRLEAGRPRWIAGIVWPIALVLVSLVLLNYREV